MIDCVGGFSIICAIDRYMGIAKNGAIPWRSKRDLQFFKKTTIEKTIIMGRKTWESLPIKPLPNRNNVVLSRKGNVRWEDALKQDGKHKFVIGGREIYQMGLNDHRLCNLYITYIDKDYDCDLFFPKIPPAMRITKVIDSWVEDGLEHSIVKFSLCSQ